MIEDLIFNTELAEPAIGQIDLTLLPPTHHPQLPTMSVSNPRIPSTSESENAFDHFSNTRSASSLGPATAADETNSVKAETILCIYFPLQLRT
jgi:hypothetical protein